MMKLKKKNLFLKILIIVLVLIVLIFLSILITANILYRKYDLDINKLTSVNNGVKVYSSSGTDTTLYNTDRSIVEIETLPKYVLDAFVSTEDKHFYSHHGFDLGRIAKASLVNLVNRSKDQGASTISQQLIKNALLTNEKTYSRKIKEIILAIKLEKKFTKNEILEMYLNTIYFGSNAYGIENASVTYFNKSAKDLTMNEACCLAGIIKSPNYYSPKTNYDNAIKRKNLVARLMKENGYINDSTYVEIRNTPLTLSINKHCDHAYEEEAIHEACSLLGISERELINRKYQIFTFKDDSLQDVVSNSNTQVIDFAELSYQADLDSLSVVVNNKGQVIAYFGNSNYNLHNISRQSASTLKPLAVYLPALKYDIISPASRILDEPINYNGFSPKNADNSYHGYVSAREALSTSLNIPAVKTLDCVGLSRARDTLSNLGIEISNSDMNLSLALGATKNGIRLMDLLGAYNTISNLGKYRHLTFIDKILDNNGKVIYQYEDYSDQVIDSASCYLLTDMLKDSAISGTSKRLESLNIPIASKTGTASIQNGNTDLYNISYSSEHTMLSWISSLNTNLLPKGMHSSCEPTEINKLIAEKLYADNRPEDFIIPDDILKCAYDSTQLEKTSTLVYNEDVQERYLMYDYFKITNLPTIVDNNTSTPIIVTVNKKGTHIEFNTKRNRSYKLVREYKNNKYILDEYNNISECISYVDGDAFKYDKLKYYLIDDSDNIISDKIEVRPKDYLINQITNEAFKNKKKWYV